MSAPRGKRSARARGTCGVCTAHIGPDEDTTTMLELGRCHTECAEDVERAIEDGGCDRAEYLRTFSAVMYPEDEAA